MALYLLRFIIGFFTLFALLLWIIDKTFPKNLSSLPQPSKPAPIIPSVKETKTEETISEPVQSIIHSLEEGWWDVQPDKFGFGYLDFTHEWFGDTISCGPKRYTHNGLPKTKWVCYEDWMNETEKEAVGEVCRIVCETMDAIRKQVRQDQQRQSYMHLVDFDVN